jgi:hypothetical protein
MPWRCRLAPDYEPSLESTRDPLNSADLSKDARIAVKVRFVIEADLRSSILRDYSIQLATVGRIHEYIVESTEIVDPADTRVVEPVRNSLSSRATPFISSATRQNGSSSTRGRDSGQRTVCNCAQSLRT